jgi:hypothetical protein
MPEFSRTIPGFSRQWDKWWRAHPSMRALDLEEATSSMDFFSSLLLESGSVSEGDLVLSMEV